MPRASSHAVFELDFAHFLVAGIMGRTILIIERTGAKEYHRALQVPNEASGTCWKLSLVIVTILVNVGMVVLSRKKLG